MGHTDKHTMRVMLKKKRAGHNTHSDESFGTGAC